jgi:hypothetical protein
MHAVAAKTKKVYQQQSCMHVEDLITDRSFQSHRHSLILSAFCCLLDHFKRMSAGYSAQLPLMEKYRLTRNIRHMSN